ncbi:alpha/beta fold hydrolase [Microbacterium horticulturae]|uniref:Alpha/beta fold hydrolase n=1 Tax=Microbacterium horticulturae TaxID=3028316 RepID=A0ABY8BZ41_9MICO|nr:alpha/beta fold hydrolase [Microbacterium sp. KACC 23027]WEG09443.1 alpha/beta fold hydrolase [Microbacterium sp. KACC 23027]
MSERSEPKRPAVTADGATLDWEQHGTGDPMVLIPGQAVSRRTWDLIVPALAERFRVITYDHRGIGASTLGAPAEWSTRTLAADALAVLDAAGAERAHVVGHSMGGRIGQWLAIDAPGRVASLALISATPGDARGVPRPAEATRALAGGDPVALGPYFFSEGFRRRHPDVLGLLARGDAPMRARRGHFVASSTHDSWDDLTRITAPTLVVHGADDEITPAANGRALAERIPGAEYLEVAGGHGVYLEDPAVIAAVAEFAAQHPA